MHIQYVIGYLNHINSFLFFLFSGKSQIVMETYEGQARQRRVAEREARRARRRRAREGKDIKGHHDGLSSDDEESQSEITKFNVEKGGIL